MTDESQISTLYANKKILITGGTGFMGKVLIWKLLQSCPKVDRVYVLIRSKHGKHPMSRREEVLKAPIFDNFKKNDAKILDKLVFVCGDVGEERIGLSEKDRSMLIEEVDFVFHSAAILKMNANLRTAVNVNTVGTVRMLDLAMQMKKLQAFVHISTAYCCCENSTVAEKIYSSKHNPYDIIDLIRWMEPELLEKITPKLIYPLPNTYIYSKRLTESLILQYTSKVPIIVARPSIVIPSFKEPIPGWNDMLDGPVGFFVASGVGLLRVSRLHIDTISDVIPVDIAINSILVLPFVNSKQQLLDEINVYNISQTANEHLTLREIGKLFRKALDDYPPEKILWYPGSVDDVFDRNIVVYIIKSIFLHYLPAYLIDFVLMLVGQKPFLVRVHNKIREGEKVIRYFSQHQWTFLNDKLLQAEKRLNAVDKRIFTMNTEAVKNNFHNYVDNAIIGSKKFIFKEDMNSLHKAKRIVKIMYVIDKIALVVRYYVLWKIIVFIFNIASDVFQGNL